MGKASQGAPGLYRGCRRELLPGGGGALRRVRRRVCEEARPRGPGTRATAARC